MSSRRRWMVCGLLIGAGLCFFVGRNSSQAEELPSPARPGQYELTTKSDGYTRTATIHIPQGYQPQSPPPLVIALHGAGGQGKSILNIDNWAKKADEKGFIVVAPDGLAARPRLPGNFLSNPYLWNSGQLRDDGPRAKIDDVAYIRTLLDDLAKKVPYDPTKVYATGHSNGGGMTFRLGAEMADRLAAIGTVAGTVSIENPRPAKPLPSLFILGLEDPLLPYEGGESKLPWGTRTTPPIPGLMAKWATAIGCETEPQVVAEDAATKVVRYRSSQGGPELTVIYLKGHGHQWPGATRNFPSQLIGPTTSKLDATDEIWSFFEANSK